MTKINLFLSVLSVAMTALLIGGASRAEVTLASNSTLVGDWCELRGMISRRMISRRIAAGLSAANAARMMLLRSVYRSRGADLNIWH